MACPKKDVLGFYLLDKKITYPKFLFLVATVYIILGIAMVLNGESDFLMLDEPTNVKQFLR